MGTLPRGLSLTPLVKYAALAFCSLSFLLPFLWMLSTSLKDTPQTFHVPPIWIPSPLRLENYPEALTRQPFGLTISRGRQSGSSRVGSKSGTIIAGTNAAGGPLLSRPSR